MKVKILEVLGHEYGYDDYSGDTLYTLQQASEWDEVSDEDFEVLQKWANDQNRNNYHTKVIVVSEKAIDIPKTVKQHIAKIKRENAEREEKQRLKDEADATRRKKADKKLETKERKQYEELRKKFG